MFDQATDLRNLVLQYARQHTREAGPPPRMIVLSGGKQGVGVTTLAVNLAVAAAEQGARVVLVDADLDHAQVAGLCGIQADAGLADIAAARKNVHEVLQRGPAGIQIIPGLAAGGSAMDDKAQRRLVAQFKSLGRHADLIILDGGRGTSEVNRRLWTAADEVLLTTTPHPQAVMDAYAAAKMMLAAGDQPPLQLVVNRADPPGSGYEVHRRIDHSCRRFLGHHIGWAGQIPNDPLIADAAHRGTPLLLAAPESPAATAIGQLVGWLLKAASRSAA